MRFLTLEHHFGSTASSIRLTTIFWPWPTKYRMSSSSLSLSTPQSCHCQSVCLFMKWVVECPWTFTNSVSVATKRVFKNLQQGRSGGGTGYRGDNTSQKSQKTQCNFNLETFFENRFQGRRLDAVAINEALQIVYNFEFKQ